MSDKPQVPSTTGTQDAAALMQVITTAAKDQTVDVDKLERLMAMYERIEAKRAEQAYSAAMNAAQEEMRPVSQDASNPQTRSKYASFHALDQDMRPIYAKHGFSLSFDTADGAPEGMIRVVCKVAHKDGHSERPHLDMPADGKGAKGGDVMTKTHATMAALSYAKRGLLKMVFNIAEGESDDDGNYNTTGLDAPQITALEKLIVEVGADKAKFMGFMKVKDIAEIPAAKFDYAKRALEARRGK